MNECLLVSKEHDKQKLSRGFIESFIKILSEEIESERDEVKDKRGEKR